MQMKYIAKITSNELHSHCACVSESRDLIWAHVASQRRFDSDDCWRADDSSYEVADSAGTAKQKGVRMAICFSSRIYQISFSQ